MAKPKKNNIFLFHGEDNYSSFHKVKNWKKAFEKKHGDHNIEEIAIDQFKLGEFKAKTEAFPFLGEKRLIIGKNLIRDVKADTQLRLSPLIEKTPETCILVFLEDHKTDKRKSLYKKFQKSGNVEEFKAPTPLEIQSWIQKKAIGLDLNISINISNYLSQYCEPNYWHIENELKKLKLSLENSEKKEVTKELIHKLLTPSLSSSIFNLTDSISTKNKGAALKTLQILKNSGEDLTRVFYMIIRHFRILLEVKDLSKTEREVGIKSKLKHHPFVIKKALSQARYFQINELLNIYSKLLDIDIAFKTGKIKSYDQDDKEFQIALEKIILSFC